MPDDFHAYKSNYPPGCSDADVAEHYDGGGGDVERGEDTDLTVMTETKQTKQTKQTEQNKIMPLLKTLFPSKYLKAEDVDELGGEVRAVIKAVKIEEMQDPEKGKEDKPILYFLRVEKGLVLNKTNAMAIAASYGQNTDDWTSKEILLVTEMVSAFGETKPAIRVRIPRKQPSAATTPAGDPADSFGGSGQ